MATCASPPTFVKPVTGTAAVSVNIVEIVLVVLRSRTCIVPGVFPNCTVAEASPFVSVTVEALVMVAWPAMTGSHITGTFASALPDASSARAVNWSGNMAPGLPV